MIDASEFEGRWNEPRRTPAGAVEWLPPGKGGLQTHVAAINGTPVATIRKHVNVKGFTVRVTGWVWSKPLAESVADKLHVSETSVRGFPDLASAKRAVEYALERLPRQINKN